MTLPLDRRAFLATAAVGVTLSYSGNALASAAPHGGEFASFADRERARIREGMKKGKIGAAAISFVHPGGPTWVEGFGNATANAARVGPSTIFSIQSTSKSFTAVAVLLAVQEGLLELDRPISDYFPEFSVSSRFEETPQQQMVLRLLLSHRAGFTHEAPIGNNYEPASPNFGAHVASISETWLRFPVGERYRYSNLGYDLAGFILERASGMSYAQWLKTRLFDPLGMSDSTADPHAYSQVDYRALGTQEGHSHVPLVTPLVASGGVWTSARDIANYLEFLLGKGEFRGRAILDSELWDQMHGFGLGGDYGLGVLREERRYGTTPVRMLSHRGGGFGFGCNFFYCPQAQIGWAALFNRPALEGYDFGNSLADELLTSRFGRRVPRLQAEMLPTIAPLPDLVRKLTGNYVGRNLRADITAPGGQLRFAKKGSTDSAQRMLAISPDSFLIANASRDPVEYRYFPATEKMPAHLECFAGEQSVDFNDGGGPFQGAAKSRWSAHTGRYRIYQWGRPSIEVEITLHDDALHLNGIRLVAEPEPDLFFTSDGEAVDFRRSPPTWRNLVLHRA